MDYAQYQKNRILKRILQFGLAFIIGIPAAVVVLVLYVRVFFSGRILPGVSANGTGLQSLSEPEAEAALDMIFAYPREGVIEFVDGTRSWTRTPAQLGLVLDLPSMADQAASIGRTGSTPQKLMTQLSIWFDPVSIEPVAVLDQRAADEVLRRLQRLAR